MTTATAMMLLPNCHVENIAVDVQLPFNGKRITVDVHRLVPLPAYIGVKNVYLRRLAASFDAPKTSARMEKRQMVCIKLMQHMQTQLLGKLRARHWHTERTSEKTADAKRTDSWTWI